MLSAISLPPVHPLAGWPSGNRHWRPLNPDGTVRHAVGQRVVKEARVIASGEVGPLMGSARLLAL
jgi:hypothetical protein